VTRWPGPRWLIVLLLACLAFPLRAQQEGEPRDEPDLPPGLEAHDAPEPPPQREDSEEPELPPGLGEPDDPESPPGPGEPDDPDLPPGLGDSEAPELPPGLGEGDAQGTVEEPEKRPLAERIPSGLHGFADARLGPRIYDDPAQSKQFTLAEIRLQASYNRAWNFMTLEAKGDLILDAVVSSVYGYVRQLRLSFRPAEAVDLQIGRQIMTWGTGDLLFINDLFPKDWQSFFIGREVEYLKAPTDAVRLGLFAGGVSFDLVYMPRFEPDIFISGERISFWDPAGGGFRGDDMQIDAEVPDDWFTDDEVAGRIYGSVGSYEIAAYGYSGFWKSPGGIDPVTMQATFPPLNVWGGSARGPLGPGIGSVEVGYYDSRDDPDGDNPWVKNSEFRFLAGYELELGRELTGGFQYYLERMIDYDNYLATLPGGEPRDENRHVLTARITKLLSNQTVIASMFLYYSPSDRDGYLRPKLVWKRSDHQLIEFGANLFFGRDDFTFFGQFENNSNVYGAIRFRI